MLSLLIGGIGCKDGRDGVNGITGPTGVSGTIGNPGAAGKIGQTGAAGKKGASGGAGQTGQTGTAGRKGTDGTDGADGADGQHGTNAPLEALIIYTQTMATASASYYNTLRVCDTRPAPEIRACKESALRQFLLAAAQAEQAFRDSVTR